jgi:type I restriction enzyme, S subunit
MSRGRKPDNNVSLDWQHIFKRNSYKYLNKIIIESSTVNINQSENGSDLLQEIKCAKENLISENKIKKESELLSIDKEEIQFSIPSNWIWCRLEEMSINCDGARIPISQVDREKRKKIYDYYGASGIIDKIDGYTHNGKYLLIGEDGANLIAKSTPIAFIAEGKFWVNNHAHVLKFIHDITFRYMEYCLNMIDIKPYISGGFQPKLSQKNLNNIPIPLPPLSEQRKIVDFLVDFENNELKSLGSYLSADVEIKTISLHIEQKLGNEISLEFIYQLDLLKKLRQQILKDAVQGKLVPQDSNDEPASKLLEKINAEKERLIREKKINKENLSLEIKADEIIEEIPESWVWCRMGEIAQHNSGKTLDSGRNSGKPRKCLTTSNLYWGHFETEDLKTILIEDEELFRCTARKGDLLICEGGDAGRAAIWDKDSEICFQNHIHRVRFYGNVSPSYVYWYFLFLYMSGRIDTYRKGMGISNLSGKSLSSVIIPLPSLPEQKRIVNKIEQLMKLCYELELSIQQNQRYTQEFLQVALKEALEPKKQTNKLGTEEFEK